MDSCKRAAERLAEFVEHLAFDDLPGAVVETAKRHVLDTLGVALAAASAPSTAAVRTMVRAWGGARDSTVWSEGDQLPAPNAALANGILAHTLDFDDTHSSSITHMSACVVPAAVAAGEAVGADGRALVAGIVAGYEVTARVGLAAAGAFHRRGFHATPLCGAFGAAVAAGKLYGLRPPELTNALGIVGSQASGIQAFLEDGSWTKRFHAGWAAHSGVVAALLAREGFIGPAGVLESRFGLLAAHVGAGQFNTSLLTEDLSTRWETLRLAIKPYPCCHFNHAFIDAALALRATYRFGANEVDSIEALVPDAEVPIVCEPAADKLAPPTPYAALFSLPYCVAVAIPFGRVGLDDFGEDQIRTPALLELARRVSYRAVAALRFPEVFPGTLRIRLRDGRSIERAEPVHRGHPENPMSAADIREKSRTAAGRTLSPEATAALGRVVEALEEGTARGITEALYADAADAARVQVR